MQKLEQQGFEVKRGKHTAVKGKGQMCIRDRDYYFEHNSSIFSEMLGEDEDYQRLKKAKMTAEKALQEAISKEAWKDVYKRQMQKGANMNTNSRNVTYSTVGDYQLPNLTLNQPRKPLGKYGRLRRTCLLYTSRWRAEVTLH